MKKDNDLCGKEESRALVLQYSQNPELMTKWLDAHEVVATGPTFTRLGIQGEMMKQDTPQYFITIDQKVTFPFFGSIHDAEVLQGTGEWRSGGKSYTDRVKEMKRVRDGLLYSVLSCIGMDRNTPDNFHDFCSEYGYDEDSRKAFKTWESCIELAHKLRTVITQEESYAFPS